MAIDELAGTTSRTAVPWLFRPRCSTMVRLRPPDPCVADSRAGVTGPFGGVLRSPTAWWFGGGGWG